MRKIERRSRRVLHIFQVQRDTHANIRSSWLDLPEVRQRQRPGLHDVLLYADLLHDQVMKHSPAKLAKQRKRAAELKAVFAKKGRKPLGVVAIYPKRIVK